MSKEDLKPKKFQPIAQGAVQQGDFKCIRWVDAIFTTGGAVVRVSDRYESHLGMTGPLNNDTDDFTIFLPFTTPEEVRSAFFDEAQP